MSGVIVHEWLARTGGSENVFEVMSEAFPDARRFCLWNDSEGRFTDIEESILARTPLRKSKSLALPFMPLAWRMLPAVDADWVLCSSHAFAHHARFKGSARDVPKFVYAHTPARYVWVPELDGRGNGVVARAVAGIVKPVDRRRAQEPVAIAANSRFVADRIAASWGRDSTVIYPPVDVDAFTAPPNLDPADRSIVDALPVEFLLGVSRFVPYKRLDAVIDAGMASGLPVVLAGAGPDEGRLRAIAEERMPGRVQFVHHPSLNLLRALYRRAAAVVFAPVEDFGIVPIEAMASGTPVIVNAVGGASETVVDGVTGAHVHDWSRSELRAAFDRAMATDPADAVARAGEFGSAKFSDRLRRWILESGTPSWEGANLA